MVREPVVIASHVERSFGAVRVVADLDLEIGRGRRVALVGANGSGKSTVLRLIAGTLTPGAGRLLVGGHPAGTLPASELTGVSLSQERSFYARLTGRANLEFFARVRGRRRSEARRLVTELGEELDLGDILPKKVSECSTGMAQQLSFARALIGAPELVLLDEPTRSLDEGAAERLWAAIGRRPETAFVIATHRADDVSSCDEVVELGAAR